MAKNVQEQYDPIQERIDKEYEWGFVTEIDADTLPKGLDEGTIAAISAKKKEPAWMLEWRLKAYRSWLKMKEPHWPNVKYPRIDFQDIRYYSAPKSAEDMPKSMDEVDPEIRRTFEKLGIPLEEQMRLSGIAVDAVFDSVSVATTFKDKLAEVGVIFCSFSEAVTDHPE
ncbi:MAG: Fe-S cluster assembly protein SufB, partial [Candidatus Krumholzibacteriota bacterium]|nr:Fe-S cluster assembly protein SufB [Candidatus Krumholzibacteriota bacterium]